MDHFPIPECLRDLLMSVRYIPNHEVLVSQSPYIENVEDAYRMLLLCLNENQSVDYESKDLILYGTFVIHTDIVHNIQSLYDKTRKAKTAFTFIKN